MFRLANNEFEDNKEMREWATKCITNTISNRIKSFLKDYYDNNYNEMNVDVEKVILLFDEKFINEIKSTGINCDDFLSKKIKQLISILEDEEELTPDIFIEYMLYRMIIKDKDDCMCDNELIETLNKFLYSYGRELEDIEDLDRFVIENSMLITNFNYLLGIEYSIYESKVFWDYDFKIFDDFGFIKSIDLIKCMKDYGICELEKIFLDIELPLNFLE